MALLYQQPLWAQAIYRCQMPDGRISYQQGACPDQASATSIETSKPTAQSPTSQDYSVTSQAERMRAERQAKERAQAEARQRQAARLKAQGNAAVQADPVRCAHHRAEAARWQRQLKSSQRTREERVYRENKIAYHQAIIERYCRGLGDSSLSPPSCRPCSLCLRPSLRRSLGLSFGL
ncbi:DUF4124 domain-containing protein [Caldichromatium japonicum]|uniref:DUF4124 domain-containing protein n=1 Tax=Caldichromatium japonicum TaxID=2699430 RepID=A0A6G7VEL9_9GAMM|nr:DUF4124 domain-containing protein [Caldichromatium japonicum]QIK38523.1 DUF4124 domain-containing protein [Caldichromatium japonicum]